MSSTPTSDAQQQAQTMTCAVATAFGEPKDVIRMSTDMPLPTIKPGKGEMLIKVHACSLSPGDYRMLSGDASLVKYPKDGFPYIPGGDVSGVVVEVDTSTRDEPPFKVGDEVVASWTLFGIGGLAEYAVVKTALSSLKPKSISFVEGAALANTASHAVNIVETADVKPGERVLVLGGSGGLGTIILQLLKKRQPEIIVTTSTATELVKSLGADMVIDHTKDNWWEVEGFASKPFDVIIDCAEGVSAWHQARHHSLLKSSHRGGRFIAVVPQKWRIVIKSVTQMIGWMTPVFWRQFTAWLRPWVPRYVPYMSDVSGDSQRHVYELMDQGDFKLVLDSHSPFPFTEQGVQDAFDLHQSRRGKGKIVIQVAPDGE